MIKDKIKSIVKSKIFVGVLCFILGGVVLGGPSGIDITEERYNQLLEMEKVALGKTNQNSDDKSNNANNNDKPEEKKENKPFAPGETAYLSSDKGVNLMSLTINSAKLIDDRNKFSDKKADKVVEIEYTYENIGFDENLQIFDSNFKIYDKSGNALETYPAGGEKHSQAISKGKKCTANMSFALNDESNELEIEFYKNPLSKKANGVFTITAE
ncbi:protein of unknown function [Clostridium collagenovorans DSM 3089]|uniref:DUF4352 domain-containing protein n=1 Tax=Clostridium collagenovorans DSM 3089 TaxID=1121306 RepID=A0A1M5XTA7_9CLOT|nr:DUF4352 domain-containing protein [Clostridium collagenovorans]SHI02748.1 protein of unknown function [Clostridium collagenovorans DSM 3089]